MKVLKYLYWAKYAIGIIAGVCLGGSIIAYGWIKPMIKWGLLDDHLVLWSILITAGNAAVFAVGYPLYKLIRESLLDLLNHD